MDSSERVLCALRISRSSTRYLPRLILTPSSVIGGFPSATVPERTRLVLHPPSIQGATKLRSRRKTATYTLRTTYILTTPQPWCGRDCLRYMSLLFHSRHVYFSASGGGSADFSGDPMSYFQQERTLALISRLSELGLLFSETTLAWPVLPLSRSVLRQTLNSPSA